MPDIEPAASAPADSCGSSAPPPPSGPSELAAPLQGSAWLLVSQGVGLAGSAGVAVVAVRLLSVAAWGHYATVMALIAVATVFANSGIGALTLREMSAEAERSSEILGIGLLAVAVTGTVTGALLIPVALAAGLGRAQIGLVALAIPLCFLQAGTAQTQAALGARESLPLAARSQSVGNGLYIVLALGALFAGLDAGGLIVANVVATAAGLVAAIVLLARRRSIRPRFAATAHSVAHYVRAALPLASIGIVTIAYDRLDVVMLSALRGPRAVAHYTVPYNLVALSAFIPSVVSLAFFPSVSRVLSAARDSAPAGFLFVVRLFLLLSVPLAIVVGFAGSDLLTLVFGHRYARSAHILAVMAATPVVTFQIYAFWYPVLAARQERRVFWIRLGGLALNLAANAVLIPLYGAIGAAVSWIAAETATALAQCLVVHRYVFPLPIRSLLARPAAAAAAAVLLAGLISRQSPLAGACLGAALYTGALLLWRYVRLRELAPVLHALIPASLRWNGAGSHGS
jgi:O-antigen/teichoic acid export membrane protein